MKSFSRIDRLCMAVQTTLHTLFPNQAVNNTRPSPADSIIEPDNLTQEERKLSEGLVRVDHVGEICAQALYQGHAFMARDPEVAAKMTIAAEQEVDHLRWCQQRLNELEGHTSYLNPVWYGGAFTLGVLSGVLGDRWSLGFVAETERQVVRHLEDHLNRLPEADKRTEVILMQMKADEAEHAHDAMNYGGTMLPIPVRWMMRGMSKVMTTVAFYI